MAAVGNRTGLVLVAQSMGGATAQMVCDRLPVGLLVLLMPWCRARARPWPRGGATPASGALSRPVELADRLEAYRAGLGNT